MITDLDTAADIIMDRSNSDETIGLRVVYIEAFLCAYPDVVLFVFVNQIDIVVVDAAGIASAVFIRFDRIPIISIDPFSCADP